MCRQAQCKVRGAQPDGERKLTPCQVSSTAAVGSAIGICTGIHTTSMVGGGSRGMGGTAAGQRGRETPVTGETGCILISLLEARQASTQGAPTTHNTNTVKQG